MMQPLRAAIIGTGGISLAHVHAQQSESDRTQLIAAVDIDTQRVEAFCQQHSIGAHYVDAHEMLAKERPDLVHICTPPGTHCELAVAALEAGAWVLCEKPLCVSLAEMDRIEQAEQRSGRYCASVFQWRFGAAGQHVKRLIDAGELGPARVGTVLTTWYRTDEYYAVPWRGKWETESGGVTMIHGIHAIDFFLWLLGDWQEVQATIATLGHDIEVEDVSMAMVQFANGAMGSVTNSVVSPREATYMRLDFEKVTVEWSNIYGYSNDDWRFATAAEAPYPKELEKWRRIPGDAATSHTSQLTAFLNSMDRQQRPLTSGPGVRGTIEFLASLYKSAMTRQPVRRGSISPDDPFYHSMCGPGIIPACKPVRQS